MLTDTNHVCHDSLLILAELNIKPVLTDAQLEHLVDALRRTAARLESGGYKERFKERADQEWSRHNIVWCFNAEDAY